jgi:hypothetical protein
MKQKMGKWLVLDKETARKKVAQLLRDAKATDDSNDHALADHFLLNATTRKAGVAPLFFLNQLSIGSIARMVISTTPSTEDDGRHRRTFSYLPSLSLSLIQLVSIRSPCTVMLSVLEQPHRPHNWHPQQAWPWEPIIPFLLT